MSPMSIKLIVIQSDQKEYVNVNPTIDIISTKATIVAKLSAFVSSTYKLHAITMTHVKVILNRINSIISNEFAVLKPTSKKKQKKMKL